MSGGVLVGVVDSGVAGGLRARLGGRLTATRRFGLEPDGSLRDSAARDDRIGHGTAILETIAETAPAARFCVAQVFDDQAVTAPLVVAAAIDWLTAEGVRLINMSFGLTADRAVLGDACRRATAAGGVLIASAPAQGAACYPAAYDEVLAVTGDARCDRNQVTDLQGRQAAFGTWCASPERAGSSAVSGASRAAAHFTGLCAAWLEARPEAGATDLRRHFQSVAIAVGPERRASRPD